MGRLPPCLLLALLCVKVALTDASEGKEIADKLGDDLSFASKQVIRGFTALFAPILDTAHGLTKRVPGGNQNFHTVLLRDGFNALGKGVKASATILSSPARVVGTGLEEARKVGKAGLDSRLGQPAVENPRLAMDDKTKIASTLLNTTASELSQANLGAVLVEVALKNRIKDMANRTSTFVVPPQKVTAVKRGAVEETDTSVANEEEPTKPRSNVDELLERFNEAVRQNDERVLNALRGVLARINPPKN